MYVAVRGWLEFDHGQREQVERTLAEHRDDQYADGWGDDDLDRPVGFFLLSDERQRSTSWTVRDGEVADTVAPAELRWFAERP
ncbi:hypothetical protein [Amycolatopsis sp. WQ 127309]|uniref:hypothetical protein n=1 Tax=Amycolatopsis sp. WQ 127309 TaxID=2932773 RepID=UPI001FF4A942|nr:hypothetical protein [Amycolatopsis sp. WQ 127309]UOZ06811.1 hypothetical protein MUY22_00510 [Amycolatopsis sp. WQ 127309]